MFGDRGEFLKIKSYARYNPIQTSESLSQKCVQAILPHTHRPTNQIQRAMAQSGRISSRYAYTNQSYTTQAGNHSHGRKKHGNLNRPMKHTIRTAIPF
jgi:hypothetical protein